MASSNPLLPNTNHFISVADAKTMTARFRDQKENVLDAAYRGRDLLTVCETFNRDAFDTILAKPACVGLRIYLGMDADMKVKLIIVGVDSNNDDLLPEQSTTGGATGDVDIIERGVPCPPWCPNAPL